MTGDRPIYFMFKPDGLLAQAIECFRYEQGLPTDYPHDRLHSTVLPLWDRSEMDAGGVQRVRTLIERFCGEPFVIAFNRFNGAALRATAVRAFKAFRTDLQRHLRGANIPFPDYSADPHISLAYGRPARSSRVITPFVLRATHLLLIESIHGRGHVELGRWPLRPRQGQLFD
ncbi:hypothetical protein SCH01S_48_01610 [Sphingomonas changbaiensis NBRC 104936]|uniref:2'-5' RNA ligase n=1 Tax=Sphingomonas changbaiensis NBRC 104936 TaxID=1219043 RepID=A0A0E9MSF9_9SPHN|nr:hypothetical protein [Sphingomonas changbaiensis]GAO40499.1 hypothetical protein SCH01S_48_01610 [Sphingomonas changbaiensis NBRC 104936]